MEEEWRDVNGYEGIYQVSNIGRIKSLNRISAIGRNLKGIVLKQKPNHDGYYNVGLHKDSVTKNISVHVLVANAFLTAENGNNVIDHIDRNRQNNIYTNLKYTTLSDNQKNRNANRNCSSKYKGVSINRQYNKWSACIAFGKKKKKIGLFETEIEAANAYDKIASLHGRTTNKTLGLI